MWTKVFIIVSLISLCLYLYGILISVITLEPNLCKMTYMFEYPQFVKLHFKTDEKYHKYGLYAHSEGFFTESVRNMKFNGAPVIFVPGNSGSYKQARSLASVALRKGIDINRSQYLDYFTVDFNGEYSALFGGFLQDQSNYLGLCIAHVLKLYKGNINPPKSVILIGHSMGGKIVESMLMNKTTSDLINTIITIASPLDQPVINIDFYFESFYRQIEVAMLKKRDINVLSNNSNYCEHCGIDEILDNTKNLEKYVKPKFLNDKLLITIGGGSRDLLIHAGLTTSKYSDIHAMSTSIPNVWLTTDHLCSVWCLQQVIVITRFLYSIIEPKTNRDSSKYFSNSFIENKADRLRKAKQYFMEYENVQNLKQVTIVHNENELNNWIDLSQRVFIEKFDDGFNSTRVQMIRLIDAPQNEILYVEGINVDTDDWIFGCAANEVNSYMRYCVRATSLSHLTKKLPSLMHERKIFTINLHKIKLKFPNWTHVLIRTLPTNKPFQLNIDVHGQSDRQLTVSMPKWYSYSNNILLDETSLSASKYTININGLEESHNAMELELQLKSCSKSSYHSVGKVCVPWTKGFDRYHYFTETNNSPLYIYVPVSKPSGYNTTINPIKIELYLDPECRYTINIKNSFGMTMARIVQQYSHWLFAHLLATLFLAMKYQMSLTPKNEKFKCSALYSALFKCSPFLIVTTSKVFTKLVLWLKALPNPDPYDQSLMVSIILHGSAVALLSLVTVALWMTICLSGNITYKILMRFLNLPIPTISGVLIQIIQKLPITIGVLLIGISVATCGGIGLICANIVYFILLSNMYEDYLEEFVYDTVKLFGKRLFRKKKSEEECNVDVCAATIEENTISEISEDKEKLSLHDNENLEKYDENINKPIKSEDDSISKIDDKINAINNNADDFEMLDNQKKSNENDENNVVAETLTEEQKLDAELDKLLKETMEKHKAADLEKEKELLKQRAEYDSIKDGLSPIHFHMSLFLLLLILTILNLPSVFAWAKNYTYAQTLRPDPSLIPCVATLVSLSFLWQLSTPKNIYGYRIITSVLYVASVICILYCRESVYRLNAVVSAVFIFIAIHQLSSPLIGSPTNNDSDDNSPETIEMRKRIEQFKEEFLSSGGDENNIDNIINNLNTNNT